MYYLVGVSTNENSLIVFIKDDSDNIIEAISKADFKFALKNGIKVEGYDTKNNAFEDTYFESDVYLCNEIEKSAITKYAKSVGMNIAPIEQEFTHLKNQDTGEVKTLSAGLKELAAKQGNTNDLTSTEKECLDKLSQRFGVTLASAVTIANFDNLGGFDSLDSLDGFDSADSLFGDTTETDEYGEVTPSSDEPEETEVEETEEEETEEQSTVAKLFDCLTDDQNAVLRRYYLWYSQRAFELAGLEGKNTNIHRDTKRMQVKRDAIAKLKRNGGTFMYAGMINAGVKGRKWCSEWHVIAPDKDVCSHGHPVAFEARCEFKHKLQVMHIAWDVEKADIEDAFFGSDGRWNKNVLQVLKDNEDNSIVFGITCIGDFFDISPEYRNYLAGTQRQTVSDMETLYDFYGSPDSNCVAEINNSFSIMDEFLKAVQKYTAKAVLLGKPSVLDAGTTQFYIQCRETGLIPPKSLVQMVRDTIIGWDIKANKAHKFTKTLGCIDGDFFIKVMNTVYHAEFNDLLEFAFHSRGFYDKVKTNYILSTGKTSYKDWYYVEQALRNYFEVYFKYEICGDYYKYRATEKSKDEGGASKQAQYDLGYLYKTIKSYLWKDVSYSIEYIRKMNQFYQLLCGIKLEDYLTTPYQIVVNNDTHRYSIDFNYTRVDTSLLRTYATEEDSQLALAYEAINEHTNGDRFTYRAKLYYYNYTIDECIQLVKDYIDTIKNEQNKYNEWVIARLTKQCDEKNEIIARNEENERLEKERLAREAEEAKARTEQEKKNELAELTQKDVRKLTRKELLTVLESTDTSTFDDKQKGILSSALRYTDLKKLSHAQMYHLERMFNQVYHPDVLKEEAEKKAAQAKTSYDIDKIKESLLYAQQHEADFDLDSRTKWALDHIGLSVLKTGNCTENQYKYIEPIVKKYEELTK